MMRVVSVCMALFLLAGCQEVVREHSEVLREDALIVSVVHTPASHKSELGLTAFKGGPFGMDYSGDIGIRIGGGLQISESRVPEKFAVLLRCEHGEFLIERRTLYQQLKGREGQWIDVSYREIYRTTYETKDGERQIVSRVLTEYDFLDAALK